MMDELADIVVGRFDGSLKAEHGTGRNMAPFVEKEWGEAAYRIMLAVKETFDPRGLLNPGVIINENPKIHLENLKPLPAVDPLVDKCMECGFCEPGCVAEGLTLSPRGRIVVAREQARSKTSSGAGEGADGGDRRPAKKSSRRARYLSDETCATDGLCALACPVHIDTGKFVKAGRHDTASGAARRFASAIGHHLGAVTALARGGLRAVHGFHRLLGDRLMGAIAGALRALSFGAIPQWNRFMPNGARRTRPAVVVDDRDGAGAGQNGTDTRRSDRVVYFPSCINRSMGTSKGDPEGDRQLTRITETLLRRAGYTILYPDRLDELCCGMAFSSKGFTEQGERKSKELEEALLHVSEGGSIPVLFDMSPCFHTFLEACAARKTGTDGKARSGGELNIYDPVEFMLDHVMPRLTVKHPRRRIALFPVCSVKKIGMEQKLMQLARMCAHEVVSVESNCCGFAGDRGFIRPELNAHGLRHLTEQIPPDCKEGFSTSRTCEIGMNIHSNTNFRSIFYLIDEVTG
jgi:D-lactate dehydrogenase